MADPKLPKQLSEESPLVEFAATGNLYVDPAYTSQEVIDAEPINGKSPITGEALVFDENTLTNLGNTAPSKEPEDDHAIFVSNLNRGTARGNGHDMFFGRGDNSLYDVYVVNSVGGDFSASPRKQNTAYAADSDGILSVYIEGSTYGGNLMGFGSQTGCSYTGDYEFTFKNSQAQWFCITFGTGYGMGENNAGNERYGAFVGNIDLLVDGSTITNNGAILRGSINPGEGEEKAYLKAYIKNSLFQGEFGVIQNGVEGGSDQYKSNVDIDVTVEGSTFTNVFLMLPNTATNTQAKDGKLTVTGDINFKATNTRFSGLNMGAGLGGTGWNRTGWVKGDITFDISGSSNSSRTFIHKGFVGSSDTPQTVSGSLTNSVFGDFTGYDTRENNYIYADTTVKIAASTIGNFTFYNTINSSGNVTPTADRVFGAQTLEVTGSTAGTMAGNGPGADQPGATFDLIFHASEAESATGAVSKWNTLTVDAGAKVRVASIADVTLVTLNGAELLSAGTVTGVGTLSVVDANLPAGDVILISGLTAFEEGNIETVQINGEEYTYGVFGGQYSYTGGNLVAHMGVTYVVNSNYEGNGVDTELGPKGYKDIDVAQTAAHAANATLVFTTMDDSVEPTEFTADVNTLDINTMFLGTGSGDDAVSLDGMNIIVGNAAADVDSADVSIAYAGNIGSIGFGNVTGTAKVSIENAGSDEQAVGSLDLTGSVIGDADITVSKSYFDEVKLADQAATAGKLTISSSTIGTVYGGASNLEIDMTGANAIENVFAEGNGASIKLGTSKVTTYVAGFSEAGAAVDTLIYNDGVSAEELIIGGNANQIGKIEATVTGGEVEHLIVGNDGDTVTGDVDLNLAGGIFSTVSIAENAAVGGKINVALTGGTVDTANGTFYGLIYGASVTGALDGGAQGTERNLVVDGYARVGSITNFSSIEVKGGTLNVESGDRKSDPTAENLININGDITNYRAIQAGGIIAEDLNNFGLVGVLRSSADDPGIQLSGNFYSDTFVRTSTLTVANNFVNFGEITSVGDITVGGTFTNAGQIYIRSSFDKEQSLFSQDGGIKLGGVDMVNTGDSAFISTGFLTGVKNLTTSKLYVTGGAEITGNITIEAGAEVAFTNKAVKDPASPFATDGLKLTGEISMYDTSNLIVSGSLTSKTKTLTINGDGMVGSNVLVHAEGGLDSWTIAWGEGLTEGSYGLVKSATEIMIYSIDELFVSSAFAGYEDGDTVVIDGKNFIFGLNAFATVEDATYFATSKGYTKSTIAIYKDNSGIEVDTSYVAGTETKFLDVALYDSKVGSVIAKDIYVESDSTIGNIAAASSLVIDSDAFLTIGETIPEGLSVVIDATDGSGARKVLAVDPEQVTFAEGQVTVLAPLGNDTYAPVIVGGEVFLKADANIFLFAEGTEIVDGSIDKTTGDALFAGVNAFTVEAEAAAAAKASGGTLYLADGSSKIRAIEGVTDIALVYSGGNSLYGNDANAFVSNEDYSVKIIGSTSGAKVYGLNKSVTLNGDYTFYMADSALTSSTSALYIVGNDVNNVVNGDINAELVNVRIVGRQADPWSSNGGWNEGIYLGYGSFGTDSTAPIDVNVTLRGVTASGTGFYGIQTQPSDGPTGGSDISTSSTPKDQQVRQDINANINIKVFDSVIGGTFTVLNTNNEHWNASGASLLNTYFSSGSITVEVGNSDFGGSGNWRNIRLGASLQGGGKAIQEFNVPNILHIVATENGTTTRAAYVNEWDTLIVDATAQLWLNNEIQYSTGFDSSYPLDDAGTLTQIMINMSGYKSGTHNVITAGTAIATDATLSNITVIGDNDLTGQCQLAYAFSSDGTQLRGIYVFDKADDMYVNATYDNSISGTKVSGQELLLNYNAFTGFEQALAYADEWKGTIIVTGGAFESQDFHGNNVEVGAATIGTLTMANVGDSPSRSEVTLTVKDGAVIGSADGSNAKTDSSILEIAGAATIGDVFDFDTVSVKKGIALELGAVSGAGFSMFADNELSATSVTFNGNEKIVLDVTGYTGKSHAIISTTAGITGFDKDMVTLVAHDKGKVKTNLDNYSVMVVGNDLVLRNAQKSDTYLNSAYTAASMVGGVTLEDGSYLEYGFNAFDDATAAAANLGAGSKFTLNVTGGEIAGDIKLGGNNFVMDEGVVNGVVYACVNTADKGSFYSGKTYTVTAGTLGGFDLTAGEGVYVATNSQIKLGEDVTITGNIIGGGDTVVTSEGKFSVAGLIMGVSEIVLNADGFLSAGGIDLGSGEGAGTVAGTIRVKSVPFTSEEGNRRLIIESDTDIKNVQFVADPGTALYSTGKQVYVVDLTRVYYDPTYTEAVDGTKAANGDTLLWGVNAFSSLTSAKGALITGGTLYVSNANTRIGTDDRLINLVITDSNVPVMISGMTSGDKSFTGADAILIIENTTIGQDGESWLLNRVTAGNPWDHHNTIGGNLYVTINGSTIGGNNNQTTHFIDYLSYTGTEMVFDINDTIIRNDLEFFGDSGPLRDGQTITINMTNVTAPANKWWRITSGNPGNAGDIIVNIKDSSIGTSGDMRFGVQSTWQWGTPTATTNITFSVEDSYFSGYLTAHSIDSGRNCTFTGEKTLIISGSSNYIRASVHFSKVEIAATSYVTGSTMALDGATVVVDGTGYEGPTKTLIWMNTTMSGVDAVTGENLADGYEVVKGEKAIVISDGVLGNMYYDATYTSAITGVTSAYGDVLIYSGDAEENIANAVTDLDVAKTNLTEGNKLFVAASEKELYGTLADEDETPFVDMVVTNGNFSEDGSVIAAAEAGKTVSGNSVIELAGGSIGKKAVTHVDEETGDVIVDEEAVYATISGDGVTGTSEFVLSKVGGIYADVSDFDKMTVTSEARVHGTITVDALTIENTGFLTVDGTLDTQAIHIATEGYSGASKQVLVADALATFDENAITVDEGGEFFLDRANNTLWLVSTDPGNIYFNTAYDATINGTSFNGDLLFFQTNAFNAISRDAISMGSTSEDTVYVLDGNFGAEVVDLSGIGSRKINLQGGSVGGFTVDAGSEVTISATTAGVTLGTLTGVPVASEEGLITEGYSLTLIPAAASTLTSAVGVDAVTLLAANAGKMTVGQIDYILTGGALTVDFADYTIGDAAQTALINVGGGINNFLQYTQPEEGEAYSRTKIATRNNAENLMAYYDEDAKAIFAVKRGNAGILDANANNSVNGTTRVVDGVANTLVYGFNIGESLSGIVSGMSDGDILIADGANRDIMVENKDLNAVITNSRIGNIQLGKTNNAGRSGNVSVEILDSTITARSALAGRGTASDSAATRTTLLVGVLDEESGERVGSYDFTLKGGAYNDSGSTDNVLCITQYANMTGDTVNVNLEDYTISCDIHMFDNIWNVEGQKLNQVNVSMKNVSSTASKWMWIWDPREANTTSINFTIENSSFVSGNRDYTLGLFGDNTETYGGEANVYINGFTMTGRLSGARGVNTGDVDVAYTADAKVALHVAGTNNIDLVKMFKEIEVAEDGLLTGGTISLPENNTGFILRGTAGYDAGAKEFVVVGTTINNAAGAKFLDAEDNEIAGYKAVVGAKNVFVYKPETGDVYFNSQYDNTITGTTATDLDGTKSFLVYGDNAVSRLADAYTALEAATRVNPGFHVEYVSTKELYTKGYTTVVNGGAITNLYGGNAPDLTDPENPVAAEAVASVDITVNKGASITNLTVANELSQVTGNAVITITDDVAIRGAIDGGGAYVGGTSDLVFTGAASAASIVGFDNVTINANDVVALSGEFTGAAITIDAANFADFSKKVMTATAFNDVATITIINDPTTAFGWKIVDDGEGKALLITSDLVKDTYANAAWTAETALGFVDETALVWDQNAFNSAASAAAAVGEGNVLYIEGGIFGADAVTLANNNDVVIKDDASIGALTTGGKVSVSKALTATSISGSTALSLVAGNAVAVSEGIALAADATITIDVTGYSLAGDDVVVLSTGSGITIGDAALTDAALTVTGTGAGSYHAYYSTEDSSVHLLRLNTFYLDTGFEGGVNVPEFSPYTGEKLIYNVNAFDRMNASGAKMVDGQKFWATHRNGSIHTGGPDMAEGEVGKFLSEVHVVESNVDRIVLGGTNGNLEYTGDVHVFIDKSTVCTVTDNDSWLFSNVTADNPWNNRNTITGSFTVDITDSTIGTADGNASPLRIMNYTLVKDVEATETTEAKKSSVNVNIKDSTVYNDIRFIGDSPMGGQDFSILNISLDNVTVGANRGWAIRGGGTGTRVIEDTEATDPLNASLVTVTIKDSTFGNNTRFAIEDNWNAGGNPWESPMCASDFVFDLTNVTINGALIAGRRDMGESENDADPELPNYTGDRVLTVNGSNYVKNALWFKTVNLTGDSSLQGDTLRLFSKDSKINVDLTGYEGPSRVIVALNYQYDDDGNIIGGGIENFDATKTLVVTGLVEPAEGEEAAYTLLTDYDAETGTVSKIVVKGGIQDVFVSSFYNEDDFEFGTAYKTGEAMFYGENAFSTIVGYEDPETGEIVPGALTSLAIAGTVLHVTGGAIETDTLLNNSITIDANATLAYQGDTTITVDGTIQNNGNFVIDASGFVAGSPDRVTVLVADEILGNDIKVTTKAYAVEKALNELTGKTEISLVLKAAQVFVNTAWANEEPGTEVVIDGTTAYIGYTAFASADAAATKVNSDGSITVIGSTVAFTNAIARGITLVVDGTSTLLNTTIGSDTDGALLLQTGAIASGINVSGKSAMVVEAGATVTGGLGMSANATVTFAEGSTLDFYIVGQSALEGARVTNLSSIGESAPNFTVTIDAGIKDGTYKLATGAAGFDSSITLQTEAASFIDLTIGNRVLVDEFGAYFEIGMTENNELVLKKEASQDVIFVNSNWKDGETYTIGDVTVVVGENGFATGDAAAAKAISAGASTIKVVGGKVSFTDGIVTTTLVQSGAELASTDVTGTLTVSAGATISGIATFAPAEGKTITVDGTIAFDTANATAEIAQFTGLSNVLGNATYTLTVTGEVQSGDSFLLATGAAGFASTVALTGSDIVLTVGETQKVGELGYTLTLIDGNLALNISDKPVPTLVYVNSTWTAADGETVQIDDQTTATMGYDAFKFGNAAYAGVTADGAIIVLAGEVSFSSAIAKTVTVNDGATLTGNATITTAITVDGTIAFDTQFATNGAQISGLNYVTGATKYTLAAAATAGTWTLATDAVGFASDITFGDYTLKLGEELVIDDYSYTVSLFGDNNTDLILTVVKQAPPTPDTPTQAYVNSEWTGLEDGTIVTVAGGTAKMGYDAFATLNGGISGVTDDGSVNVVGGTVSFSEGYSKTITVDAAATVVGTASFKDKPITINGTIAFDTALAPRAAAQFAFLQFVSGDTKYTLTDAAPAEGTYLLASGLWYDAAYSPVFNATVTFGDVELALNQAVQVGDYVYTLGTTGNLELTLKVTKYVAPSGVPSFFTGWFDGQQAMFAREIESNVKFYDTTATEWGTLALGDGWSFAGVGDFNNDGMDDVLRLHTSGLVVSDLSNGDGTFTESILNFKNAAWDILGTGDFNGDGKDDVLVANSTAASATVGLLGYWANGTDWTLINGYSDEWTLVDTGDYDGNGCCDMLWKNSFVGEGGGTYNAYCTWRLGDLGGGIDWSIVMVAKVNETETPDTDAWSYLTTGDFNGDGIADIAMVNDVGTVAIATMASTGISSTWTILSSVDTNEWHLVGTDDFNGDGTDDIAWCNSQGLAGYWQINDKQMTAWQNIGWLA